MADEKITLSITADAAGLKAGVSDARKAIEGLAAAPPKVGSAAEAMSDSLNAAFDRVAAAAPTKAISGLERMFTEAGEGAVSGGKAMASAEGAMAGLAEVGAKLSGAFAAVQQVVAVAKLAFDALKAVMQQTASALNWSGELSDTAAQLRIGVEALQEYRSAAKAAGVDSAQFSASMTALRMALDKIQSGFGGAQPQLEAFTRLGFTPVQLAGFTSVDQLLPEIADRLKAVGSEAERAAIADRLGIRPLLPMLEKGSVDLEVLRQKAADAGGEIDGKTAAAMRQLKADVDRASEGINGNLKIAFLGLGPVLDQLLNLLNRLSRAFADFMQSFVRVDQRASQALSDRAAELRSDIAAMEARPTSRNDHVLADDKAELAPITAELAARERLAALPVPGVAPIPPAARAVAISAPAAAGAPSFGPKPAKEPECGCDPAAMETCEAQKTDAATAGAGARAAAGVQAAGQVAAADHEAKADYVAGQDAEVGIARAAGEAKAQAGRKASQVIVSGGKSAIETLKADMDGLVDHFAKGLGQMIAGTASLVQVLRGMGQMILQDIINVIARMVDRWLWGVTVRVLASTQGQAVLNALGLKELAQEIAQQTAKTGAVVTGVAAQNAARRVGAAQGLAITGAADAKDIVNSAATAAGKAYNSLAGVPFVGPVLGAAAAASTFAAVMAFKGLIASAAGGFDIPAGVNPLTQLHAQEMVLPAHIAQPMRAMLADYGAGGAPWGAGNSHFHFGDFNVHGAPSAMSSADFRNALSDHASHVATAVASALRGGWRPSYRQPTGLL